MRALIGTFVKTGVADHAFADREQAEAFVMSLKLRESSRRVALTRPAPASTGTGAAKAHRH